MTQFFVCYLYGGSCGTCCSPVVHARAHQCLLSGVKRAVRNTRTWQLVGACGKLKTEVEHRWPKARLHDWSYARLLKCAGLLLRHARVLEFLQSCGECFDA
ncbi:hypothetical protein TRVL_08378 [Trypanosoma vivax]|nr:hypothetical protein TRVL_08378 [Trypanosoma vivax]